MTLLSIVVPCYNEETALPHFYATVDKLVSGLADEVQVEYIFVDDGSKDGTLNVIQALRQQDKRVGYITFSRNFGKEGALLAGLEKARGDLVVVMDADLQDPPELLPEMVRLIHTGAYDCVATRRVNRKGEPVIRSFFARAFYRLINRISQTEMVDGARDYRMMTRQMVDALLRLRERNRFSKGLFTWVGFRTKWLEFENVERIAGETKWSFWKLLLYSFDGIVGFSTVPLAIASIVGLILFLVAVVFIFVIIFKTLVWGDPVSGWPSTVSIILFIGGIQLFCIGILGQYLAKTYLETKQRPIYITRDESTDADAPAS